ncbi:MAG: hypothetical protein Q8O56_06185 [Solirubrobacteraceae bacterium]|nr:hypothetical protein [Solirubrobacteraceae bacterium]
MIAGTGDIWVAPTGTPLPVGPTVALNSAFRDLGYTNDDGVTLTWTPEVENYTAWQSRSPIRRELTSATTAVSFGLLQWNQDTVPFAFGGGIVTEPTPGIYRLDFLADGDALEEVSLVAEFADGDKHYRVVIERGTIMEAIETQLTRGSFGELPVSFEALTPESGVAAYMLTDDPSFDPDGS